MLLGVAMDFNVIAFSRGVAPVTTPGLYYNPGALQTAPRLLTPRPRAKASRRAIGKTGFYIDRVLPAKLKKGPGSTSTGSSLRKGARAATCTSTN